MDNVTREIFRAWNWPNEYSETFSHRPTPYNISRYGHLPSSSVYRKWHFIFDSGIVREVMLLPADSLIRRHEVILSGADRDDFEALASRMEKIYFLERTSFGRVYRASGSMKRMERSPCAIVLELVDSSSMLAKMQADLILQFIGKNVRTIDFPQALTDQRLSQRLERLIREISYSDVFSIRTTDIAERLGISTRTVRREMDSLLRKRQLFTFPLMDQSVIRGFRIALAHCRYGGETSDNSLTDLLNTHSMLSERYLRYRMRSGIATMLLYYESVSELDAMAEELSETFHSFALFTRYETRFNQKVLSGLTAM